MTTIQVVPPASGLSRYSAVPSIGYGVAYAIGNVLLAIWGTVIVVLLA